MEIVIRTVDADHEDLKRLIEQLDSYLLTLYPQEEIFTVQLNKGHFIVAYDGEQAVGCGGIVPYTEQIAELKRFYVDPSIRNRGVANHMLVHLEHLARAQGVQELRLETGEPQYEAVQFYIKHGFEEMERFGEYTQCESSRCYVKKFT
ncbi:N-acetylglutamate synthase-like GNAT family acetyltransferase [Paenibacillus shirakamiensis]|uniref:N-acetylglutamate synthase-like GNAT family acetyltransferase n=1 Tax=Paenibacillus shirakamiensis TaxID=1265935 RepID=A0ABS4JL32_9BACL|nr:GNAT family N-acetyltransferase [Paenibacillus shirakamiensis]MBP2002415.1 N-acetylglutamate synthase-like GNAT family acetyltransferase [Paenibacillus shirakamiensis]